MRRSHLSMTLDLIELKHLHRYIVTIGVLLAAKSLHLNDLGREQNHSHRRRAPEPTRRMVEQHRNASSFGEESDRPAGLHEERYRKRQSDLVLRGVHIFDLDQVEIDLLAWPKANYLVSRP